MVVKRRIERPRQENPTCAESVGSGPQTEAILFTELAKISNLSCINLLAELGSALAILAKTPAAYNKPHIITECLNCSNYTPSIPKKNVPKLCQAMG